MEIKNLKLLENGDLEGKIILSSWAGFQNRLGAYPSVSPKEASIGRASLHILKAKGVHSSKLDEKEVNAYKYLIENQSFIQTKMLTNLLKIYPELQEVSGLDEEDLQECMPHLKSTSEFKNLISLSSVYILNNAKENISFVGFGFDCSWDDEHGVGIMTHKEKIIEIGEFATAFGC